MISLFSEVLEIKGIGSFYASQLARLDVYKVMDLLWLFPKEVLKINASENFSESDIGKDVCLNVKILYCKFFPKVSFVQTLTVGGQNLTLVFFKSCNAFKKDADLCVSGKLLYENDKFQMKVPLWKLGHRKSLLEFDYKLEKVPNLILNKIINEALTLLPEDELDKDFLTEVGLCGLKQALHSIHNGNACESDWNSIAFVELLAYRINLIKAKNQLSHEKEECSLQNIDVSDCLTRIGFELTKDQKQAWKEILWDLTGKDRMLRMLYGDVGSGKTILTILASLLTYRNGKQAAILAPTQILAIQHFELYKKLMPDVKIVLLTSSTKTKQIYHTIATEPCIIIGTHALIEPKIKYHSLALLIIDEHHRFGVLQRIALTKMGLRYHLLIMSATPIPRTLKLLLMQNIEISRLLERPQKHRDIAVHTVYYDYIELVYEKLKEHLVSGGNVFWVCPLIEHSELKSGMDVATRVSKLKEIFNDEIMVLHGRMKNKDQILSDFQNSKGKILVTTTVIEVGVNIPNANLMIIENSENFGLAQLYQLLGRVGRGEKPGECYLVYTKASGLTKHRLEVIKNKQSGIQIAEADMVIRGYGNILGTEQNGKLVDIFKVFDPEKHLLIYDKVVAYMEHFSNRLEDLQVSIPKIFKTIQDPWSGG